LAKGDKSLLPQKTCRHCGRIMVWRKKWRNNWEDVQYCSDACRRHTPALAAPPRKD
jgi:hypothetical protein